MNATAVKQFHDDLRASVVARVPVEIAETQSVFGSCLSLNDIDVLEQSKCGESSRAGNLGDSNRYRSAIECFESTGSMAPILTALSANRLAINEVSRVLRRTFYYLGAVLVAACLGLLLFWYRGVPAIEKLRADLELPWSIQAESQMDLLPFLPWLILFFAIALLVLVVWWLFGGATRVGMWLGGRRFVNNRTGIASLGLASHLVEHGVGIERALLLGCDVALNGDPSRGKMLAEIQSLVAAGEFSNREEEAEYIDVWRQYLETTADQSLSRLKTIVPPLLVCFCGGLVAVSYCVVLYWPIMSLLRDMTTLGSRQY